MLVVGLVVLDVVVDLDLVVLVQLLLLLVVLVVLGVVGCVVVVNSCSKF